MIYTYTYSHIDTSGFLDKSDNPLNNNGKNCFSNDLKINFHFLLNKNPRRVPSTFHKVVNFIKDYIPLC